MTWFRVDDGWPIHSKTRRAGDKGRALWAVVGPLCAREDTDGHVDPFMLTDSWANLAGLKSWRAAANALVACGLWHDHETVNNCGRCSEAVTASGGVDDGWFYFHDWDHYQLDKDGKDDPIKRNRAKRKRHLHRSEEGKRIKAAVVTRDQGLCRYCGQYTSDNENDHKSDLARSIDHINPFDWVNSEANCCVACKRCNGIKRDRTPEDANMVLLAPGTRLDPEHVPDIGSDIRTYGSDISTADSGFASRDARDGPGSGRTGNAPPVGIGSDQNGHGPTNGSSNGAHP